MHQRTPEGPLTEGVFEVEIIPQGVSSAERHSTAFEILRKVVEFGLPKESVSIVRSRADAQNLGDVLVAILSTTSLATLAYGIHQYCAKRGDRVEIKTEAGSVTLTGAAAEKASIDKIVSGLAKLKKVVQ